MPPPDGGYPGFMTAEGTNALKNLTNGVAHTATGWYSLFTNSSGNYNTGVGAWHPYVEEQLKVANQQKEIDDLKEELKEQRYLIQKVSDKIDVSQSATKVARREP